MHLDLIKHHEDECDQNILALRAVSTMLYNVLHRGDADALGSDDIDGIGSLFRRSLDGLEANMRPLVRVAKDAARSIDAAPAGDVIDPNWNGPIVDALRAEATAANTITLRKQFIADKLREGVASSDIAQALNMKRAAVEKLAGQLVGEGAIDATAAR